jgi:hypothetical protein
MVAIQFKDPESRLEALRNLIDPPRFDDFCRRVSAVVRRSFQEERENKLVIIPTTESEIRRRASIVYDWYSRLRNDFGYSHFKAMDFMGRGLQSEIRKENWTPPPAGASWADPQ